MLHRLPDLHRDADREDRDEPTGERGGEEAGRGVVEDGGDGDRERREVGAAASREPARSRRVRPRGGERAGLGCRDCAVLGAVQAQRAAAEEPEDDQRASSGSPRRARACPGARRTRTGAAGHRAGTAARGACHTASADERSHRGRQLEQAADQRDPRRRDLRIGIVPSCSSPDVVANAQKRSLTITTPFGRAMPPSFGSAASGVGTGEQIGDGGDPSPTHSPKKGRPASAGRPNPQLPATY